MPSIYTHDNFGNEVKSCLPKDILSIIEKYPNQFRIGLQGPDPLFFYKPLIKHRPNRVGHIQHGKPASDFFGPMRHALATKGTDCPEYAYILGFICHFILDSECHGFVNEKSKEKGFNHLVMEMEFDRYLMEQDGENPVKVPIYNYVPQDSKTIDTMSHVYKFYGISRAEIKRALWGMRFYKRLFTTGKSLRRLLIRSGMFITTHYRELEGHMMGLKAKANASITNEILMNLYLSSIQKAVSLIEDFHDNLAKDTPLNQRFYTTFKNNQTVKD